MHLPHISHLRTSLVSVIVVVALTLAIGGAVVPAAHADDARLRPVTECVIVNGDGTFTAFFGYRNDTGASANVRRGPRNSLRGARSGLPPETFRAGRIVAAFSVTTDGSSISWTLDGVVAMAVPSSTPCSTNPSVPEAPVALALMVAPALLAGAWIRRRRNALC